MTTREQLRITERRMNITIGIFMTMMLIGVYRQNAFLAIGSLIATVSSSWIFAARLKCPQCRGVLFLTSRRRIDLNFCPGCARSIDEEQPGT